MIISEMMAVLDAANDGAANDGIVVDILLVGINGWTTDVGSIE